MSDIDAARNAVAIAAEALREWQRVMHGLPADNGGATTYWIDFAERPASVAVAALLAGRDLVALRRREDGSIEVCELAFHRHLRIYDNERPNDHIFVPVYRLVEDQ